MLAPVFKWLQGAANRALGVAAPPAPPAQAQDQAGVRGQDQNGDGGAVNQGQAEGQAQAVAGLPGKVFF